MKNILQIALVLAITLASMGCNPSSARQNRYSDDAELPTHQADDDAYQPQAEEKNQPTQETNQDDEAEALRLAMCAPLSNYPEQILTRKAYVVSFNSATLLPNWVAWRLTRSHADGPVSRKGVQFMPDEDVEEDYRVTHYDYSGSGYDRGHMCPAGDNKWDAEAMSQCFLMTNMCPQDRGLNAGDWNEMEIQCRRWAEQYGEIYIVCGPIIFKNNQKRIGHDHRITVPDAFFKVVLCLQGTPKGIGFIYRNRDGNRPKGDYVNSIDEVERITGFDFFPALPDDIEDTVEAEADLSKW